MSETFGFFIWTIFISASLLIWLSPPWYASIALIALISMIVSMAYR